MADIIEIDLTDVQDSQQGLYQLGFELTSYANGTSVILEAGRSTYIGGSPYRVDGGNLTVTGAPANGTVYLYVSEDGDGTATAELLNNAPTYSPTDGAFYFGLKKALFVFTKTGSNYDDRIRISGIVGGLLDTSAGKQIAILGGKLYINAGTIACDTLNMTGDIICDDITCDDIGADVVTGNTFTVNNRILGTPSTANGSTDGVLYSALSSRIPNTGDRMLISGGLFVGTMLWSCSYAERINATQILVYGWNESTGSEVVTLTSGGGTGASWSIMF